MNLTHYLKNIELPIYIITSMLFVQISCSFSKIFSSFVPTGHQHSPTCPKNILQQLCLFLPNIQGPLWIKANPEYNKRKILNWSKTFFKSSVTGTKLSLIESYLINSSYKRSCHNLFKIYIVFSRTS